MRMIALRSSAIVAAGYDPGRKWLDVEFTRGQRYRYLGVPESVFGELMASASKGDFVNRRLVGRYLCVLLGNDEARDARTRRS